MPGDPDLVRTLQESRNQLRQLAAHIEAVREQERSEVAREMHDELGQMLTVLKMDMETLGARISENERREELLRRVEVVKGHIQTSVGWVKRISARLRPGVLDHLGLGAAIEWQASDFQSRTGIKCVVKGLPDWLHLDAPRSTAAFRILQDVLSNAAQHSGCREVQISIRLDKNQLAMSVKDDGRGIPKSRIEDPASLGLASMKERALLLGGSVRVHGSPGKGTTVTLRLPMTPAGSASGRTMGPAAAAPAEQGRVEMAHRILIADDHTIFREGLKELITERVRGAACEEAENGAEALTKISSDSWDLVILDVAMPIKSGLQVLREVRLKGNRVPVLMVSTYPEETYGPPALKAGAQGYVSKSQTSDRLIAEVMRALSRAEASSPSAV